MTDDQRRPGEPEGASAQPPNDAEHTQPLSPTPPPPPSAGYGEYRPEAPGPQTDPGAEDTSRLEPPIWQGSPVLPPPPATDDTAPRPRGRRRLMAGVLVAALVVGGAAGVGGAAAYDALTGERATPADTAPQRFEATTTSVVQDGTVESVSQAVLPSVVKVNVMGQEGAGSGSGIVLSEDGNILTNNHVIASAQNGGAISVSFSDGTTSRAEVVGTDPLVDIAVIRARDASGLTPASIGRSDALKVGQSVVAIGSPFGLDATVTSGIVSALNRPVSISSQQGQQPFGEQQGQSTQSTTYPAVQTDAAINPGNSGGPLVDMSGRVVGINSSIRSASSSESGGQAGSIGLGFAIPIDEVLPIVNQIVAGDTPTHARLGVSVGEPQASIDDPSPGAQVSQVESGGAGEAAGLQVGDVVTKVDDQVIEGADSLVATIRGNRPGDQVTLTYERDGQTRTARATLGSDEGQPAS